MHNSSTALPGNHSWPGVALFAVIFLLYVMVAPSFAVPGRWAGIVTAFAGMDPFRPVTRPVWSGLVALVSALPIANLGAAINVLTAAAGAGCCWLLYDMVRRVPFARGMYGLRDAIQKEEAPARLMAGLAAALFAAASLAMIRFSAYGDYAVTDMLLLLLALYPVLRYRETGRTGWLCMSCAFMGLALVEYPTAAMIFPVFLGWWILTIWRAQQRSFSVILAGLLSLFAGLVALGVFAAVLAGSGMAEIRDWAGTGTVLVEWTRLYFLELTRSVPRVGWLLIFGMTLVPFIAVMLRPLEESADFFSRLGAYSFRLVLIAVAVLVLFELPGSPAYVMGPGVQLLAPSIVVAVWSGFLIAYLVMTARQAGRRKLAGLLATAWFAALLFASVRHVAAARVDHLAPVTAFADELINRLDGRDFIVTDGIIDPQLRLAARRAGLDLKIMNLQETSSRQQARYHAGFFVDDETRSLALIGLPAALRDWVTRDASAADRIALMVSPDVLRLPGMDIRPAGYFYRLAPGDEFFDGEALLDDLLVDPVRRQLGQAPLMAPGAAGWFQWQFITRWFSRMANDTGFMLSERGRDDLAVEAYQLALDTWPENASALMNLIEEGDRPENDPERKRLLEQLSAVARQSPRGLNARYLHAVSGLLRNPAAMMAYMEQRGDEDVLKLDQIAARLDVEDERSLFNLARLYLREQNPEESEAIYRAMLETNPQSLNAHYGLFRLAMARGELEQANVLLADLEALGADPERLQQDRAMLLFAAGKLPEARQAFLALTKADRPTPEAWMGLLQVGIRQNDQDLIDTAFTGLERERDFVPGLIMLGERALMGGRPAEARAYYTRALALDAGNERALLRLMDVAFNMRDAVNLRRFSAEMLAMDPEHAYANLMAAYVHIAASDYGQAEASLRRSLRGQESGRAYNELAWVLAQQERYEKALEPALKSVELQPDFEDGLDTLAVIQLQLGKLDDAVANIQQAATLAAGRSAAIALHAAEIFIAANRRDEAAQYLQMTDDVARRMTTDQQEKWRLLSAQVAP